MTQKINSKYIYEFAAEKDGEEIASLLERKAFQGDVNICYAKRPNAYISISKDGEKNAIVIARNTQTQEIAGVGICIINEMYVSGEIVKVGYLCGLRTDENSTVNIVKSYKMLKNFCSLNNVKYTYTTILKDNLYAQKMLTKKRKTVPAYIPHSKYVVNIIKKGLRTNPKYNFAQATEKDFSKLCDFIEHNGKSKNFFPHINKEKLKDSFFDFTYKDFYLLKNENNEILCCGILWKQWDYKQLIVKNYSTKYKIMKNLVNPFLSFFGYPKFPKENEIIKYSTLSFVLSKNDSPVYLEEFIKYVSNITDDCDFFVYGATADTKEAQNVFKLSAVKYESFVYLVDWNQENYYDDIRDKNLHIECGLL